MTQTLDLLIDENTYFLTDRNNLKKVIDLQIGKDFVYGIAFNIENNFVNIMTIEFLVQDIQKVALDFHNDYFGWIF